MPLKPEDYEAIRNLYGRYSIAIDTGDMDAYLGCFSSDAVWSLVGLPDDIGRNATFTGHDELRSVGANIYAGTQGHVLHNQVALTIDGDGDEARVKSIDHVTRIGMAPHSGSILTGGADDVVVRDGDRWVYKSRIGYVDRHDAEPSGNDPLVIESDRFVDQILRSYRK